MQYRNGRPADVGHRVIGFFGSQVVTGFVTQLEPKPAIQAQDTGRTVNLEVDLGSFFHAQDALAASNAAVSALKAPLAPLAAGQAIATIAAPAPVAEKPLEPLAGWPS